MRLRVWLGVFLTGAQWHARLSPRSGVGRGGGRTLALVNVVLQFLQLLRRLRLYLDLLIDLFVRLVDLNRILVRSFAT